MIALAGCGGSDAQTASSAKSGGGLAITAGQQQTVSSSAPTRQSIEAGTLTLLATAPSKPSLTPIQDCISDTATNKVIIGVPDPAKHIKCQYVNAATSSMAFGEIQVQDGGLLTVPASTSAPATLNVSAICLEDGATFTVGSPLSPITSTNRFTIRFTGKSTDPGSTDPNCMDSGASGNAAFSKGIDVTAGATLNLYGAKGIPADGGVSWTTLSAPAGIAVSGAKVSTTGTTTLNLTDDVTKAGVEGWAAGDWIVVATSSFNPYETEFVQIKTVTSNAPKPGSTVTLLQPLKHYHFGSPPPSSGTSASCPDRHGNAGPASYCDGASTNFGVDERAEVGLISRDIELIGEPATATSHWGGEIKLHQGFTKVGIQGVRLSEFGKAQQGSYPIHFHMTGSIANTQSVLIDANSVDHSYNKCITIHDTSNLTISNMVCARIVGHIFYEELDASTAADDENITFENNLGLGAMSNSFDINVPVTITSAGSTPLTTQTTAYSATGTNDLGKLLATYWWAGDYMTNDASSSTFIGFDGFNIPDTDNQSQPTHGNCYSFQANGQLAGAVPPPCTPGSTIYAEPASGFWIQNPGTNLIGNSIGGCQGVGNGFWWVPPAAGITVAGITGAVNEFTKPLGTFKNNRAHACYQGFYGDSSIGGILANTLQPQKTQADGTVTAIISTLDGLTATRNRFRGLWLRGTWFVLKNGRFATNRDNISLLTSGGIDGNAPGAWNLLSDSVIIGLSQNNVDRWGPCPYTTIGVPTSPNTGGEYGCIDYTYSSSPHSGDIFDNGYQTPKWNSAGYYLYDGPALVFHDRFVNFNYNAGWTTSTLCTDTSADFYQEMDAADCAYLQYYETNNGNPSGEPAPAPYEGDAAFGWFLANQNSYPTGTASSGLSFVNTNLRHEVFTSKVGVGGQFDDGDKNTSVLDEDGTLSGLGVQLASGSSKPVFAISLNNLPFNNTSNSVDECLSRGAQNEEYEGRTSALMSPATMGTLQFSSLYPYSGGNITSTVTSHQQDVQFTRDDLILAAGTTTGSFPTDSMYPMLMKYGRNGLGSYEPKVSNGYGYEVTVAKGLWSWIDITLADIVDPNISSAHPFYIRLGVNYASASGKPPSASYFAVKRGYKSYFGGGINVGDPVLKQYWTQLDCFNLDSVNPPNVPVADGGQGKCPGGTVTTLNSVSSISGLTNADGTPNLDAYYYDTSTGYLYLNIAQEQANPIGPSPTGSCSNTYTSSPDANCPDNAKGEAYYACPKQGCVDYTIAVKSDSSYTYVPGPATGAPAASNLKAAPSSENSLVKYSTTTVISRTKATDKQGMPYYRASAATAPACGS